MLGAGVVSGCFFEDSIFGCWVLWVVDRWVWIVVFGKGERRGEGVGFVWLDGWMDGWMVGRKVV